MVGLSIQDQTILTEVKKTTLTRALDRKNWLIFNGNEFLRALNRAPEPTLTKQIYLFDYFRNTYNIYNYKKIYTNGIPFEAFEKLLNGQKKIDQVYSPKDNIYRRPDCQHCCYCSFFLTMITVSILGFTFTPIFFQVVLAQVVLLAIIWCFLEAANRDHQSDKLKVRMDKIQYLLDIANKKLFQVGGCYIIAGNCGAWQELHIIRPSKALLILIQNQKINRNIAMDNKPKLTTAFPGRDIFKFDFENNLDDLGNYDIDKSLNKPNTDLNDMSLAYSECLNELDDSNTGLQITNLTRTKVKDNIVPVSIYDKENQTTAMVKKQPKLITKTTRTSTTINNDNNSVSENKDSEDAQNNNKVCQDTLQQEYLDINKISKEANIGTGDQLFITEIKGNVSKIKDKEKVSSKNLKDINMIGNQPEIKADSIKGNEIQHGFDSRTESPYSNLANDDTSRNNNYINENPLSSIPQASVFKNRLNKVQETKRQTLFIDNNPTNNKRNCLILDKKGRNSMRVISTSENNQMGIFLNNSKAAKCNNSNFKTSTGGFCEEDNQNKNEKEKEIQEDKKDNNDYVSEHQVEESKIDEKNSNDRNFESTSHVDQ